MAVMFGGAALAQSGVAVGSVNTLAPVSQTGASAVRVYLTQFKVTKGADGKEQLLDAASVKPGDVIEYQARYVNRSARPITGLVGELPIQIGLEYQRKSARPDGAQTKAATAEGIFAAEPLMRKVGGVQQEVLYSDYRTLRWALGQLPPGGETSVRARARVQGYVAPAAEIRVAALGGVPTGATRVTPVLAALSH